MEANNLTEFIITSALFATIMGIIIRLLWDNRNDTRELYKQIMEMFDVFAPRKETDEKIIHLGTKVSEHETRISIMEEWRKTNNQD